MTTAEADIQTDSVPVADSAIQNSDVSVQNVPEEEASKPEQGDNPPISSPSPRPLRIYTRAQILALSKSPLVTLPPNMPELKDWFGAENEQNLNKKDSEPSTPNSGRERRFRRDAEEGDLPARPSFRSSLSQPSQMGNFKHQSLRSNDRDRDLDKDRDGQERLRNLSDKYDRDRLALPLRSKDRDIAPHLASSSRLSSQTQGTIATRRAETREAAKKKIGEANEDWRRVPDQRRTDRAESGRGEREERPRSRSRHRGDLSLSRRDRDREDARKDRDRERDDYKRDREDLRRDRDRDEDDDPRRWRDDGKRDERMAARRDRDRARDKEGAWENSNDRRWISLEDRDARSKRNTGREKKSAADETRGDERRGEREKEKEPAWMEPYIPSSSNGGFLGGKGGDGELDGLQAWKKNMKEKELKASKASENEPSKTSESSGDLEESMDEIQKFKVMMRLAQKSRLDNVSDDHNSSSKDDASPSRDTESAAFQKPSTTTSGENDPAVVASAKLDTSVTSDPSRSLLSLLNTAESRGSPHPSSSSTDPAITSAKPLSRLPLADPAIAERAPMEATSQFNPPQGSRLLALGNRAPGKPPALNNQSLVSPPLNGSSLPSNVQSASKLQLSGLSNNAAILADHAQNLPKLSARSPSNFSPFEEQREAHDSSRRPPGERTPFMPESGPWPDSAPIDTTSAGHTIGKGSRFAKFFDGKGKEQTPVSAPPIPNKAPTPVGYVSASPGPHQLRPDSGFGGVSSPSIEHRTVDDLFAKLNLNNTLQSQRTIPVPNSAPSNSNISFGQQAQNQLYALQQQQLQSQNHQMHGARMEPLYESRNFMPDNLVPGLRSAPPARNRENGGMFSDPLDEAILLSSQQRLPVQQQRGIEQLYAGSAPTGFAQQQARNAGIPIQPPQFRGGPSPLSAQHNVVHGAQQQRLPPGLANLGARPPHDPSQYLGMPGLSSQAMHAGLHVNGPPQQHNFHPGGGTMGFGAPQNQLRAPPPGAHQLQNTVVHHQLGNLGHPSNLDVRSASQAQLLALNGIGSTGLRGVGTGQFNPQQANSAQLQNPLLAMRQQQGPLPPHMLPHLLPPHLQQQSPSLPNQQSANAQDLMALLMGTHRD